MVMALESMDSYGKGLWENRLYKNHCEIQVGKLWSKIWKILIYWLGSKFSILKFHFSTCLYFRFECYVKIWLKTNISFYFTAYPIFKGFDCFLPKCHHQMALNFEVFTTMAIFQIVSYVRRLTDSNGCMYEPCQCWRKYGWE